MAQQIRRPGLRRQPVSVRIDPAVWRLAQSTAERFGVPLPGVIERQLVAFIRSARTAEEAFDYIAGLPAPSEGIFGP